MEESVSSSTTSKQQQQRQEDSKTGWAEQRLISSEKWLQLHGLKSNKLTLNQILSQIGFPHCEDYVTSLGRPVASRYADGLFPQFYRAEDGRVYNLTAKAELISRFAGHLAQALESCRRRMAWLTSGSRQIFGVILEQCVTLVLDFGDILEGELHLCREALVMVLQEQVAHIAKVNFIWVTQEPVRWQEHAAPVTRQSLAAAIKWVEELSFELTGSSAVGRLDALLEAGEDDTIESIYYFVVGDIPEESKELLLQRAVDIRHPVHTVSFNARGEGMMAFLKDLSAKTHGRFHAFAERTECMELPAFLTEAGDSVITWNSRKLKGKLPPGAGVREDVFLIWREMEEAFSTLAQVQRLVAEPPKPSMALTDCESVVENESDPEDTWDSKKWLQKYGLKAQKLSFYDVLADCSFRHADGVVEIKAKPENESLQTSAETKKKIVHAKYCNRFIHAAWKDGSLVHVNVTKEKFKWYSERVHTVLARIQRRIKWLEDGSRILFGKVCEACVYVLIDTSHSMKSKLGLVKNKIIQFIQEQLKYKSKFNFVTFDGQAVAWREKLAEINEDNLKAAQSWIRDIKVGSSTNTLAALQIAFADKETQVIYLLTDGRPDQLPEMVIEHVKVFQKIPIYTISFNYNDKVANEFLQELASLTGGEFHSYNFGCKDPISQEALQQNEDVALLVQEMEQGCSDLEKVQSLYSKSLVMDWWYNGEKEENKHRKEISSMVATPEKCAKPQSDVESMQISPLNVLKVPWDLPNQQKRKVLHAESTKTSLLRSQMSTLKSSPCSERKDSLSKSSSWTLSLSDKETSILLTNEYPDDGSVESWTGEGSQICDDSFSEVSSASWLQTHGLVARKLTIMDALSGTTVPHSPTYVPILDKHVTSKVFDEVFPLAHVCSDTNKMTLVNPQGVKLNIYKQKVEQAIKSYEKRLNKIVWQALSQEEKEKLDAIKPIRYLENKTALNKALERLNWPISLKELSMLENEILAGKMYIHQAMELQEATKRSCMSKALGEQQKLQGNPTKKIKSRKVDPLKGQKVIARCDENGFYFPGIVKKCLNPTHALVGFKYGDTKVVPTSFITPVGGAMPCPLLQVGDYVFAKIVIPKGFDFYVPAIVIALPNPDSTSEKFYTVLKCNNRREFCPRSALIKISQNKYALSCSHIKSPPLQENPKGKDVEDRNSAFVLCPLKDADTGDSKEPKQENPRRKKKKPPKRPPLQEVVSSDSDDSSRGTRSQESHPKTHPEPEVGGGGPTPSISATL